MSIPIGTNDSRAMSIRQPGSLALICCLSLVTFLAGCVQTRPVPGYARSGDAVVLGLGGIHRNVSSANQLKPSDLSIVLTDAMGTQFSLTASHVFKSYPSYNSVLTNNSLGDPRFPAFDGGWFAVVPLSNQYVPLAIAPGPASIAVSGPDIVQPTIISQEGDLQNIPLIILEGEADVDATLTYMEQFKYYITTSTHLVIKPASLEGVTEVGGARYVVDYSSDADFNPSRAPMATPANHNPFVQVIYAVKSNGDGSGRIEINVLNPDGFTLQNLRTDRAAPLQDLEIALELFSQTPGAFQLASAGMSLNLEESYFIDINGNRIDGVVPLMASITGL